MTPPWISGCVTAALILALLGRGPRAAARPAGTRARCSAPDEGLPWPLRNPCFLACLREHYYTHVVEPQRLSAFPLRPDAAGCWTLNAALVATFAHSDCVSRVLIHAEFADPGCASTHTGPSPSLTPPQPEPPMLVEAAGGPGGTALLLPQGHGAALDRESHCGHGYDATGVFALGAPMRVCGPCAPYNWTLPGAECESGSYPPVLCGPFITVLWGVCHPTPSCALDGG